MATFIPGTRDSEKKEPKEDREASPGELFAIVGTVVCTALSALIMIERLLFGS